MCVSKYRNILLATERGGDKPDGDTESTHSESTTSLTGDNEGPGAARPRTNSALESQGSVDSVDSSQLMPEQAFSFTHGMEQSLIPTSITLRAHALDISEQIEAAMKLTGPLLCELLTEHKAMFSKVLVGANGKSLLTDGKS